MEVQEELDELKQEKREIKRKLQLADGIVKEDLYTAYYAVSENEEIVGDKEIEIPGMEQHEDVVEVKKKGTTDIDDVDTKICRKEDASVADQYSDIEKEQADLYVVESREMDDGDSEQIYAGERKSIEDEVYCLMLPGPRSHYSVPSWCRELRRHPHSPVRSLTD